ncbi:MAG: GNAT family N-acetyltransferase [Acidimicrobiales bacterium]
MNERILCLPNGERLTVRPMQATDADVVLAGFLSLSPESFRRRFFSPVQRLLPGMAEALTAVDDRHLTLVAFNDAGELVAMAEAIRDRRDPNAAELAVAVADAHQHLGIGTLLLRWLSRYALEEGVLRLTGFTQIDNLAALSMFAKAGAHRWVEEPGVYGFDIPLVDTRVASPSVTLGRAS